MVTGKGGFGKTTIAAALAPGLIQRGKTLHLSATDSWRGRWTVNARIWNACPPG